MIYEVISNGNTQMCESYPESVKLKKQLNESGYDAKIILPNGEEDQEVTTVELSEVDKICLDVFATLKPRNKNFEYTLKNVISLYHGNNHGLYSAARYITYALTGRMSDISIIKVRKMSARKLIRLIVDLKNANICIDVNELENLAFINRAIAAIK